jgi:hypothetical protein
MLSRGNGAPLSVKENGAGGGGAFVQSEDVSFHGKPPFGGYNIYIFIYYTIYSGKLQDIWLIFYE